MPGATILSVQRRLHVNTPNAMRLLALRELLASGPAMPTPEGAAKTDVERWRVLYRALNWMLNDYIGVNGFSADFSKKHELLGYAHEGYHNAYSVLRDHKPPMPERLRRFNDGTACLSGGNTHPDRCVCQEKETGAFAGTPHKHYDEPPYSCARCGCKAYEPALASGPAVSPEPEPPKHDPRFYDEKGNYLDGPHWGKDCPVGKVQIEFLGVDQALQFSPYSWKPADHIFADIYIDGERYNLQVGDFEASTATGKRRGIHITGPIDLRVDKHSINAVDLYRGDGIELPAASQPPAVRTEKD